MDEYTLIFLFSRCIRCAQKRDCWESVRFASERSRVRSAISGSLSSFVLGAIGYNVTAGAVQTAGVVNAIWKSYTGIYFLGYGIAVAILFFVYPLTKQKTAEMLTELKARRAAKESK